MERKKKAEVVVVVLVLSAGNRVSCCGCARRTQNRHCSLEDACGVVKARAACAAGCGWRRGDKLSEDRRHALAACYCGCRARHGG